MDEKIYIDADGNEWTEAELIENLDKYNKDSKTETTITFEEFLGKNPSLKVKEKKVTETEVNDKKSKRISQLESKVKGWEPDSKVNYDNLPMMDKRSALYSDYKELDRLKTDQVQSQYPNQQLTVEQQFIENDKLFKAQKTKKLQEQFKTIEADLGTYTDELGSTYELNTYGKDNEMSYVEYIQANGDEDAVTKLIGEKYPNLKISIPFDPGNDVIEIISANGSNVVNLEGKTAVESYNEIMNAIHKNNAIVSKNPIIKEIQEATFGRLHPNKEGDFDIFIYNPKKWDLMPSAEGREKTYNQLSPENVLELVDEIKTLGIDARGNPTKYLGSNFSFPEAGAVDQFSEEQNEKIANQILHRIQGMTYKEVNGEMVPSGQKNNKFTGLDPASFRDIYDIKEIKEEVAAKGREIALNNFANVMGTNGVATEEFKEIVTKDIFENKSVGQQNKIGIEEKIVKVVDELQVLYGKAAAVNADSKEYIAIEKQFNQKQEELSQLEKDIKTNAIIPKKRVLKYINNRGEGVYEYIESKIDEELASSFFKNTKLSLSTLEKLKNITIATEEDGYKLLTANSKSETPAMSQQVYARQLYADAVGHMQYNTKVGNEKFLEIVVNPTGKMTWSEAWGTMLQSNKIRSILKAAGYDIKNNKTLKISYTDLADAGLEVEEFEGWLDEQGLGRNLTGDSKIGHFKAWFEERNETAARAEGYYNLAYLNTDVSLFKNEGLLSLGIKKVIGAFGEQFGFDLSEDDKKYLDLVADVDIKAEFKEVVAEYNESDLVQSGEIASIILTKEQITALENTLAEDVVMGTAEFVPMLVKLGGVSWLTGGMGGMKILKELAWFKKLPKLLQHTIGALVEDVKMSTTMDLPDGGGAAFYVGGTLTQNILFNKRFRAFKPLFDKVLKNGPVGAASMEFAGVTEAMYDELMGNADFSAAMRELYPNADETTRRMIVNSLVFAASGVHHMKRADFKSTSSKLKTVKFNDNKIAETQHNAWLRTQNENRESTEQKEYVESKIEDKVLDLEGKSIKGTYEFDAPTVTEQVEKTKEKTDKTIEEKPTKEKVPEGYKLVKGYVRDGVSYGDRYVSIDGKKPIKEIGATIEDFNKKYPKDKEIRYTDKEKSKMKSYYSTRNTMQQMFINDAYAWELNPDNPKFETNFKRQFMEPMNQVLKSIDPNAKNIEISMGKGSTWRKQNIKNGSKSEAEWQPDWVNGKGEKTGRIVIDISAYTAGKPFHEMTHAITTTYMNANPIAKANFGRKLVNMFESYDFGENPVFEGTTGEDLKKRIDEVYSEQNEEKRTEEFIAFVAEILGNPEVYYSNPNLASNLLKEIRLEVKDILGELGFKSWAPKNAADAVELLGLLSKSYRTGSSIKRKGKAYAKLLGVDILGSQNILAKNKAEAAKSKVEGEVMSSKDLTKLAEDYKEDPNKADVLDLTDQYNRVALSALGYDVRKGDIPSNEAISFVGKEFPSIIRRYDPSKKIAFSTWITNNIKYKRQEFYEEQIGEKGKETSLDHEKAKQIAGGETPTDILEKKEKETTTKVDRQISTFEGKEAKAKEKEILDIFKEVREDKVELEKRSKKGIAGTPKEELAQVAELLFDAPGEKLVGPSKNLSFETPIVHNKLEYNGKKILDKNGEPIKLGDKITKKQFKDHKGLTGITKQSDFSKVRDYFKDVSNVERFVKTLGKYSFIPNQVRINEQGEKIDISKDVLGRGLGLPKRFVDYFFETLKDPKGEFLTPSGRTKGGKVQLQPGQAKILKSKFINPSKETIKEIQEDLLVGKDIKEYDRGAEGAGQLAKGFAVVESMKVSNEATRKDLPQETKEQKQLYADLKGGARDIMSSMKLTEKRRKAVYDMLKDLSNQDLSIENLIDFIKSDKYKLIPDSIKDYVTQFLGNKFRKLDLTAAEIATTESVARDLSKILGKKITPEQVREIELRGESNWAKLNKSIDITNMNRAKTSSKEYAPRKIAADRNYIKQSIPKGKVFGDLTPNQQKTIAKTIGEGDVRSSAKSGVGERPTTKKEYAKELIEKLKLEKREIILNANGVPKGATTADLLQVIYGKDVLKGTGPELFEGSEASFAVGSPGKIVHTVEAFLNTNPSVKEIKKFVQDLVTDKDFGFDETMAANTGMLKRAYGSQVEFLVDNSYVYGKDRVEVNFGSKEEAIKFIEKAEKLGLVGETHWRNASGEMEGFDFRKVVFRSEINALERAGTKELFLDKLGLRDRSERALEDVAGMLQQQVNRSTGSFKIYVPLRSVTSKTGNISKKKKGEKVGTGAKLHNEHETELFTMNRKFMEALVEYKKGNLTAEQLRKYTDNMVERLSQSIITEQKRIEKDATGNAVADYVNKLLYLGKGAKDQINLSETSSLNNMSEVMANELAKSDLNKLKNTVWDKLSTLGAMVKQKALNISSEKAVKKSNFKLSEKAEVSSSKDLTTSEQLEKLRNRDKAMRLAGLKDKPVKKIRVFDFDDTVAKTKSNILYEMPNGKKGKLTAEEFAKIGEKMEAEGVKWDFSEFNKVVEGKKGPLFDLMKKMKDATGDRDIFILTARSPEAAKAIHRFLKEMGIDIPLENIKGLGDSSPYAKSDWILEKAAEGYNDFYFADDAKSNVKAVRDVLEQIDVKSQVQRALSSKNLNKEFNQILEEKSGIEWYKEFSKSKGKVVGAGKGKRKFFIPPSAEDFTGLIYPTLGKGKVGEAQLKWYNDNLIKPYNRATRNLSTDKVQLMNDFKALKKQLDMPKDLRKITKSGYTKEQAARVYLWDKMGEKVPNLSKADFKELIDIVNSDGKLKAFADQILEATKGDGYSTPGKEWLAGTMTTDLIDVLNVNKRKKYLQEWQQNIDIIYSEKNLNKLEAIYGSKYREALENSIKRMKTGKNRTSTGNRLSDNLLDYINGAQGTIMFLNMRSAVLQSISAANFINLGFNNIIKAGRAFANQKQYWKDFASIMNSDYLVGRRQGLKLNISESEISDAAAGSTNKAKAVINYILEKGYAPTKFMDSFAIASGGATWYRNKIKDLIKKEGLSEVEAQKKAFEEFMEISEKSQQSSDPSKISAQQASDMGRVFLQFVNTPMQYARLQKRAFQDLANKRGDWKSHISKILYYGIIQNLWFNAMQQGLFALGFGDDEINEKEETKIINTANGMFDSILRGLGLGGMTVGVLKNTIIDLYRRSGKKVPNYRDAWIKLLEFSPAIKSKVSKLRSAAWPFDTKAGREEIVEKGFSLDNPAYESMAKVISAATNIPLDRLYSKYNNLHAAYREDTEVWKDVALFLGWPEWQLEEGGTKQDDLKRNLAKLNKIEQVVALEKLGVSNDEIKDLKKEEDRINKMMELYDKDEERVKKILNEELIPKPQTKEEEVNTRMYKLTKDEQLMVLDKLGIYNAEKNYKTEKERVDKIKKYYSKNSELIEKSIEEAKNYVPPKLTKKEIKYKKIEDKSKDEQVKILEKYGLTKKQIRNLKYENDRVEKIMQIRESRYKEWINAN